VIRSSALRLLTIAAAVTLIPLLAGCEAGVNAQTTRPFSPTDGTSAVFHGIDIRDAFVLGPPAGTTLDAGTSAGLFLALVNNGAPDQLTAVTAPGTAASVAIRGGLVTLGQGQQALLTGPTPQLVLERLSRPLAGGQSITVTLSFQNAGAITLTIPVVTQVDDYTTFSPPPPPSPSPAAAPRRSGKPLVSASPGQPGVSATVSPTPAPTGTP
jgi:copper(I)-binding protein